MQGLESCLLTRSIGLENFFVINLRSHIATLIFVVK